ncbi:cAMP-dependent protein kinase catalytic subunit PRKX isoform X1 [Suricata suricatta]|uniref:Protein kinase X-linked n=1 Tax=Suricata suricatta TaxID=37032 RepID=A0A673VHU4_SURSU|nr:cAMP-dependent protein kinase catalytic subunit PRKX isoform X1 [Suricata suricatta]XP_029785443.1 cAMP-dependent protein kinase catalytic subunit PRKX isoform X1 [Suricata suricatta]
MEVVEGRVHIPGYKSFPVPPVWRRLSREIPQCPAPWAKRVRVWEFPVGPVGAIRPPGGSAQGSKATAQASLVTLHLGNSMFDKDVYLRHGVLRAAICANLDLPRRTEIHTSLSTRERRTLSPEVPASVHMLPSASHSPCDIVLSGSRVRKLQRWCGGSSFGLTPDQAAQQRVSEGSLWRVLCTGTFGRVQLVKDKTAKHFFALKVMSIPDVIRLKQEQHVHNEKSVLKEVSHPFLVKLFWTCHDERFLYMLMEFVPGGELFTYLRNRGRFSGGTGLFYSAEIVCAIEYLHSKHIVYRDLKPENILLDRDGHIKLTDFGFAKKLVDKTWTLCGTPEYLAPEVIQSKGHGRAVDWWALGILIFEMHSGFPPFFDDNPFGIYQKILAGKIDFPRHLDFSVKDLIKKLLVVDRTRRLGNMKNGAEDVKRHRWFRTVDWEAVPQRKLKPPIVPKLCGEGDTSNFDAYPDSSWNTAPPVSAKDLEVFKNF